MLLEQQIERISYNVINVLHSRFKNFPENSDDNRNAPFHIAFLKAFENKFRGRVTDIPYFLSMSSWLQGLNTTLGQTFFEHTAHILSGGDKREFTAKRDGVLEVYKVQKATIASIMSDLYNGVRKPDVVEEESQIVAVAKGEKTEATGFSADVFYEKDDEIVAIELKSVKPNSGEMQKEKQKILEGKTALQLKYPHHKIKFYIGFPFDPTGEGISFDKKRFYSSIINLNKSFAQEEILLADELWDKLSGQTGTMQKLLDIINSIATTSFDDDFRYLNNPSNCNTKDYAMLLRKWNLFSELRIVKNMVELEAKSRENPVLQRLLNTHLFDSNGIYRTERMRDILSFL